MQCLTRIRYADDHVDVNNHRYLAHNWLSFLPQGGQDFQDNLKIFIEIGYIQVENISTTDDRIQFATNQLCELIDEHEVFITICLTRNK